MSSGTASSEVNPLVPPTPRNYEDIVRIFGDINIYIDNSGHISQLWEDVTLGSCILPFPLRLSWNPNITINKITCHKLLVPVFGAVFNDILNTEQEEEVVSFGGCYNFRQQRAGLKLSTHCWGIAIDLNPATNKLGTTGDMPRNVITIFESHGFMWGGNFKERKDPMHFQYAINY